jgi:hypothetical protein
MKIKPLKMKEGNMEKKGGKIMSDQIYNTLEVYGEEINLKMFKEDVAIKDASLFCPLKQIHAHCNRSSSTCDTFEECFNQELINKNIDYFWDIHLDEQKDHLVYCFRSTGEGDNFSIFERLIYTYKQLNFKFLVEDYVNNWTVDINASGGEYTKYIIQDIDFVDWKKNLYIAFQFEEDVLNDKVEIIDAAVFKKEKEATTSVNTSGSKSSNSENISAGTSFDELDDDDDLLAALAKL